MILKANRFNDSQMWSGSRSWSMSRPRSVSWAGSGYWPRSVSWAGLKVYSRNWSKKHNFQNSLRLVLSLRLGFGLGP